MARNCQFFYRRYLLSDSIHTPFVKYHSLTPSARDFSCSSSKQDTNVMTVDQIKDELVSVVAQPQRGGTIDLPLSVLKRIPSKQTDLRPQAILQNKTQAFIPLASNLRLRNRYNSHMNFIRMGRLLEDIDLCAGRAAFEHAKQLIDPETGQFPLVVVTALVDRILLHSATLPADSDIRLTGYVSWVGHSSVELTVDVEQHNATRNIAHQQSSSTSYASKDGWNQVLQAHLVMVARDPRTHRSVPFVPVYAKPEDLHGQEILRQSELRSERRRLASEQSLLKTIPNQEETQLVHDLFLNTIDEQKLTFRQRYKPSNAVWMSETGVKTALICHTEERNIYNKIFGGFLMRQALEIAWMTVRHFAHEYPKLVAIDDLVFKHPVEIGSMLFLSSYIVYRPPDTRHYVVRVNVEVATIDNKTHVEKRLVANTAYFIYEVPESDIELRNVYPETYADSMMYLDGKRHYEAVLKNSN